MSRLVVNPGTPQAWEIQLKQGTNLLGRGTTNDFRFDDPSISGSHCAILLQDGAIILRDLGSTNGTFVENARVREAYLQAGQRVRLGAVEMQLLAGNDGGGAEPSAPAPAKSAPIRVMAAAAPPVMEPATPPFGGQTAGTVHLHAGPRFCKFHPKSPAHYQCPKCNRTFCDLCVTSRTVAGSVKKTCRTCGVECEPLELPVGGGYQRRGFFSSLPGAFLYPLRGFGVVILVMATIVFAALEFVSGGIFGLFVKGTFYGFLFLFMQNIIHTTASDEKEPLSFPVADGLFGAAFQLGGTILISYGLAIGLMAARLFDVDIPSEALVASIVVGCLYFPMAFLAVAMKDTVFAANPLIVFPAIMKIPLQYLVAAGLLVVIYGVRQVGLAASDIAGGISMSTHDMSALLIALGVRAGLALVNMYLLTVTMRILGLLYIRNKERLEWF
ncbi:MAG: FHA domain-containing protein [Verrucomicrobiota bacterium]